jgi:hypothetical protein
MARKAAVAAVVGALATILTVAGVEIDEGLQAAVVTVVTAILVYAVPNDA